MSGGILFVSTKFERSEGNGGIALFLYMPKIINFFDFVFFSPSFTNSIGFFPFIFCNFLIRRVKGEGRDADYG